MRDKGQKNYVSAFVQKSQWLLKFFFLPCKTASELRATELLDIYISTVQRAVLTQIPEF